MAHAIRFEKTGGPDVLAWQAVEVGKARSRPGPSSSQRGRAQLHRHLPTQRPLRAATAERARLRGAPASSRRSGPGSAASSPATGSPMPADRSAPMPTSAYSGRPPGPGSRRHHRPASGRDDAEGHDGLVSGAPHPSGEARRDDPDPCRGRRGRPDRLPVGKASRRDRHRHRRRRGEGGARQSGTAAIIRSSTGTRISSPG